LVSIDLKGCPAKQVRSLASETARQSEASGKPALAWFAADFKEEMSAFDGAILVSSCNRFATDLLNTSHVNCLQHHSGTARPASELSMLNVNH
jgi:hypothetical protein